MKPPRSILLSDLHLNLRGERKCVAALERLLKQHSTAELLFVGDIFEFSTLTPMRRPALAWQQLRDANPRFCRAVKGHLARGCTVTFVCGNHDAPLAELRDVLREDLSKARPEGLQIEPWSTIRGKTYIEHGHVYDRDNAPLHPLADWRKETEPIGIALMRRFVAAQGALEFAHAHRITPASAVKKALAQYGLKTPWVAARYFATAAALCAEAAVPRKRQHSEDTQTGQQRMAAHAETLRVSAEALERFLAQVPAPTHASARAVFRRLYFDRVGATLLAATGGWVSFRNLMLGPALLGGAALLMAGSLLRGASRSSNPVRVLQEAAALLKESLSVDLVVFGHTHVEVDTPHYVNLGSFEYCGARGRPCLFLDDEGRPTRHHERDDSA